jgi:hypothetical protein
MPLLPFGEYKPDVSDYEGQATKNVRNVLPRGDGYGPFPDFAILTQALIAACRGAFYALKSDGSVASSPAPVTGSGSPATRIIRGRRFPRARRSRSRRRAPALSRWPLMALRRMIPLCFQHGGALPAAITAGTKILRQDGSDRQYVHDLGDGGRHCDQHGDDRDRDAFGNVALFGAFLGCSMAVRPVRQSGLCNAKERGASGL